MSNTVYKCILCTVPKETASELSKKILCNQLVACINIVEKVKSLYWWEGEIQEDQEVLLIMKTHDCKVEQLVKFIQTNHPYDVPEVIALPIQEGNQDYLDWICTSVDIKVEKEIK